MSNLFSRNQNANQHVSKALLNSQSQQLNQIQLQSERIRFQARLKAFNAAYPQVKAVLAGLGLFSFFMASVKGYQASTARSEIQRRKELMSQAPVNLTTPEGLAISWNASNVDEWLYKPVQITGRQLHYKAMLVPTQYKGQMGYNYIVPLVTKENEDGSNQEGILLNKGFYPVQYFNPGNRYRIENSWEQFTFTGYVSKLDDLQHQFGQQGNDKYVYSDDSSSKTRVKWNNAFLPDMAKQTNFVNQDQVKAAVVEACQLDTPLDEKDLNIYDLDATNKQLYPFVKKRSAALVQNNNPWKAEQSRNSYLQFGIVSLGLSSLFILA